LFERFAIAYIRTNPQSLASAPLNLGRRFIDRLLMARRSDDVRSSIGEAQTQRAPDSGRPPNHRRSLAFQAEDSIRHDSAQR